MTSPVDAKIYYNDGIALYSSGRLEEAISAYEKAIQLNSDKADAHYNKGNALAALGRYQAAVIAYDKAIKLSPDDADIYSAKGEALSAMGKNDEAIEAYNLASKLDPDFVVTLTLQLVSISTSYTPSFQGNLNIHTIKFAISFFFGIDKLR